MGILKNISERASALLPARRNLEPVVTSMYVCGGDMDTSPYYVKADVLKAIPDEVTKIHIRFAPRVPGATLGLVAEWREELAFYDEKNRWFFREGSDTKPFLIRHGMYETDFQGYNVPHIVQALILQDGRIFGAYEYAPDIEYGESIDDVIYFVKQIQDYHGLRRNPLYPENDSVPAAIGATQKLAVTGETTRLD